MGAPDDTLRGRENIRKRYLIQTAWANRSLLMRHMTGVGPLKTSPRAAHAWAAAIIRAAQRFLRALNIIVPVSRTWSLLGFAVNNSFLCLRIANRSPLMTRITSTVC